MLYWGKEAESMTIISPNKWLAITRNESFGTAVTGIHTKRGIGKPDHVLTLGSRSCQLIAGN